MPTEEGALQCCGCIRDDVNDVQPVPSLFMSWSSATCCAYPLAGRTVFYYDLCVWYACSCTWQACCGADAQIECDIFFFFFRIACCVVHACDRSVCNPTSGICVYIYINILKERSSRLKKKCTDL